MSIDAHRQDAHTGLARHTVIRHSSIVRCIPDHWEITTRFRASVNRRAERGDGWGHTERDFKFGVSPEQSS